MSKLDFEEPTICSECGELFELNEGFESEVYNKNNTICEECHYNELEEIEENSYWKDLNVRLSDILYDINNNDKSWNKLSQQNKESIINMINLKKK